MGEGSGEGLGLGSVKGLGMPVAGGGLRVGCQVSAEHAASALPIAVAKSTLRMSITARPQLRLIVGS